MLAILGNGVAENHVSARLLFGDEKIRRSYESKIDKDSGIIIDEHIVDYRSIYKSGTGTGDERA